MDVYANLRIIAYYDAQRLPSPAGRQKAQRRWWTVRYKAWLGVFDSPEFINLLE
jgi:hypothetical protein